MAEAEGFPAESPDEGNPDQDHSGRALSSISSSGDPGETENPPSRFWALN